MAYSQLRCARRPRRHLGGLAKRSLVVGLLALSSAPALANNLGENGPWQFKTTADSANQAVVADLIQKKQSGYDAAPTYTTTLDQVAAVLGPVSQRTVTFELLPTDEYKKGDLTHRVHLTYSGSLQTLVDQLAQIYGLDVAITGTTIRFSSRQGGYAGGSSTTRTP